jgi:hypothetical protein
MSEVKYNEANSVSEVKLNPTIIYGIFDDDDDLLQSAKVFRANRISVANVYSPFPIHGIDPVIGHKRTNVSVAAFVFGATGFSLAVLMIWYMLISDWPINVGGKPNWTFAANFPAFVPVLFESTVFCAAHGMSITYLLLNRLLPGFNPRNPDPRSTDDKFIMEINMSDNWDAKYDEVVYLLKQTGASEIKER